MAWRLTLAEPDFGPEEIKAVTAVLHSRWLAMGAVTQRFENKFAAFCGVLIYVFTNKKRTRRLESYKNIPFQDETNETDTHKVSEDERKN